MDQSVKTDEKPMKMTPNQIAYLALRKEGLNQYQAAKQLGLSTGYGSQIDKRVKNKYDLTDTKIVKKAHKAVKNLLEGKGVGTVEKVKDSTVLAAANMVYDRFQPVVKQNLNLNINQNFVDYDITDIQG